MYNEDMRSFVNQYGTILGFKGAVSIDYLYWDMDNESLGKAYHDTLKLLNRLLDMNIAKDAIRIYFSGNKGFHIIVPSTDIKELAGNLRLPQIVKSICSIVATQIESFDSVIYDRTRILRTPNSKHESGLYKIHFTVEEFLKIKQEDDIAIYIKTIATQQKKQPEWGGAVTNDKIKEFIQKSLVDNYQTNYQTGKFTYNELEKGIQNGFPKGKRNSGFTSVAGVLHRKGIGANFISAVLQGINGKMETPLNKQKIDRLIQSVCSYPIDPKYMQVSASDIITMADAGKQWVDIRKNCAGLETGFPHLDPHVKFFDPGQVFLVVARGGVGKTTFAMQLLNNMSNFLNNYGIFVSLEMPTPSVFFRAATINIHKNNNSIIQSKQSISQQTDIISNYLLNNSEGIVDTSSKWGKILLVDKDSLSLEQIEQYYNIANDKYSNQVGSLLIDYGGLIRGATDYNSISAIATGIKSLSKRIRARVIVVVQLSRAAGDGTTPVKMNHIRDSGAWEEASDYIMGAWISDKNPDILHASMLKNRFGERNAMFDIINKGLHYQTAVSSYSGNTW